MDSERDSAPKHAEQPKKLDTFSGDLLEVDDRLLRLERQSKEYRGHLIVFEDALINQIATVAALEIVLAVLLAVMVFSQYRKVT